MTDVIKEPWARTRKARGKDRPIIDFLVRCPKCQHGQHVYVYEVTDKPWIKCDYCGELLPRDAWSVITMSIKGLPASSS